MRKLCVAIFCCWVGLINGNAQSLEGLTLGCKRSVAIFNLPQYFNKNTVCSTDQVTYINESVSTNDYISLKFKEDQLCKVSIHKCLSSSLVENGIGRIERALEKQYMLLIDNWGEPSYVGQNVYWKFPYAKASFSYDIGIREEPKYSEFDPWTGTTPTIKVYLCYVDIELEFTADSFEVLNTSKSINSGAQSSGSGIVLSKNGIIATNFHVIDGATKIDVLVNRNGIVKTYKAKILLSDKTNDLSLLKIEDSSFTPFAYIPYTISTKIADVGTSVFALGYPMSDVLGEEIKLTDGLISSKTGYQGDITTYQISAPIQPGNSGGPLFNKRGELVGITNAGVPDAQNVGYAIKTSYLKNLVDVAPETVALPTYNAISELPFTDKVKKLTPFVVLIKVY